MIGEIRDYETASIAVQASITGHLVVSTLHTNSASAAFTRLLDMTCGRRLKWVEMIPIFSWLALRGRCSGCHSRISAQYPLIEAANAGLWLLVYGRFGLSPDTLLGCLFASVLLVASVIDARTREIPPGTTIFIAALGLLRFFLRPAQWQSALLGLVAVAGVLLLVLLLSGGRAVGGGDIKLEAGTGLFLGLWPNVLGFFLGCVLGSVIHVCRMYLSYTGLLLKVTERQSKADFYDASTAMDEIRAGVQKYASDAIAGAYKTVLINYNYPDFIPTGSTMEEQFKSEFKSNILKSDLFSEGKYSLTALEGMLDVTKEYYYVKSDAPGIGDAKEGSAAAGAGLHYYAVANSKTPYVEVDAGKGCFSMTSITSSI